MPKEFTITGEIGWEVDTDSIKNILAEAKGEDIKINFASPGGSVFTGFKIFNLIKNYSGNVDFHLIGEAASMGSYIPLAGNRITAEPNVVYMIHNARSYVGGDHHEMRKRADIVEGLSNVISNEYVKKTGKTKAEILQMMNDETFFFGNEVLDAGFIDEIIESETEPDADAKKSHIALAKEAYKACLKKVESDDYEQAAAYMNIVERGDNNPVIVENKSKKENKRMDLNELKAKHPDLFEKVYNMGVTAERDRVSAHLIMGSASGEMETAKKAIEDGLGMTETIKAKYAVAALNKQDINARLEDETDATNDVKIDDEVDAGTIVADLVEERMGIKREGN